MGEPPRAAAARAPDLAGPGPEQGNGSADGGRQRPWGRGLVMHGLGTLARMTGTTAFRQAAIYVASVVLAGGLVMWLLFEVTTEIISRQVVETMRVEAAGIGDLARAAGRDAAVAAVETRAKAPAHPAGPDRLYLVETAAGERLAGNLDRWPGGLPRAGPGGTFQYRAGGGESRLAAGVTTVLPDGTQLLVARDLEPQRELAYRVRWLFLSGFGALALAGLLAGLVSSRLSLCRIAQITRTSDAIMAGDLSGRVPLSGSGDELDHLAGNLNAMLDRIEQLMAGLREVSDNIAHDLKTPLTRLRARAEAALRAGEGDGQREGLEQVIEDADELIKTFNALLLIARLEAGAVESTAERFDLAALTEDVAELYTPVAEETGLTLRFRATAGVAVRANRQLVVQAVANLIDNAIKYGRPAGASAAAGHEVIDVEVGRDGAEARLSVSDHGPGIPAADRDRVLKRFVRLEASRTRPGTGLGLSLVAAVARLNGGRVLLEDNAPGLRIVLALPAAPQVVSSP